MKKKQATPKGEWWLLQVMKHKTWLIEELATYKRLNNADRERLFTRTIPQLESLVAIAELYHTST